MAPKILVIDDNAKLRDMLKTYLKRCLDADVVTSPDGFAAMKYLEKEKPELDAIILDVMMRTHGGTVADNLRHDPRYSNVLLIFYSGLQKEQISKKALEGAWFVHKSKNSLSELALLLRKELGKRETAGSKKQ